MKQVLFSVFVLPTLFVKAQKYIPTKEYRATWHYASLKGKVKKITETHDYYLKDTLNYNKKEDIIKNISQKRCTYKASFNELGNKTEELVECFENLETATSFLDSLNLKSSFIPRIKSLGTSKNKIFLSNIKFVYDSLNQLIKVKNVNENNETLHMANFVYNEKKDLINTKFFGYKNSLTDEYNNYYDKNDSLIMFEHHNYKASEFATLKMKYTSPKKSYSGLILINDKLYREEFTEVDDEGNTSKHTSWTSRSTYHKSKIYYTLDKFKNYISYKYIDENGILKLNETMKYEYVGNSSLIKKMNRTNLLNNTNTTLEYNYIFDEKNNIVSCKIFENGTLIEIFNTTYEYY